MTLMRSVGCLSRLRPPASGLQRFLEGWVIFLVVMCEPVFAVIIGRVTHDRMIMSRVLPVVLNQQPGTM